MVSESGGSSGLCPTCPDVWGLFRLKSQTGVRRKAR
jgi:hypothetical protein